MKYVWSTEKNPNLLQEELFPEFAPPTLHMALRCNGGEQVGLGLRRPHEFLVYRQEKEYSCGSACLRMILQYYQISTTERAVREMAHQAEKGLRSIEKGTEYKTEDQGIGSSGFIAVVRNFRLHGFIAKGENNSLENVVYFLNADIPVIVNWQCDHSPYDWLHRNVPVWVDGDFKRPTRHPRVGYNGHYSIAVALSAGGGHLFLADPLGRVFVVEKNYFERKWWDPTPKHRRWMLAIYRDREITRQVQRRFKGLFV